MLYLIVIFLSTLFGGIAIGLIRYGQLLERLREKHPGIYEELGKPTLFMASPGRGATLQQFIFSSRSTETGDPKLIWQCRFLRGFVFVLVPAVFLEIGLGIWLVLNQANLM